MNPGQKVFLRQITTKDEYNQTFYRFESIAKWNPAKTDAEVYLSQGKSQYFFAGFIGDNPFCTFLFIDYPDKNLLFFGIYYTLEEFRGKGLTFPLFQEAYSKLKLLGRKLVFTASDVMLNQYIKMLGVKLFGRINGMTIQKSQFSQQKINSGHIKDGRTVDVNKLINYDYKAAGYDRNISVRKFVEILELIPLVYEDEQGIRGYCVVKKCDDVVRLSPLLADSKEIAKELMVRAFTFMEETDKMNLDVPDLENHHENFLFIQNLGFETVYGFSIVGEVPHPNNWDLTYSSHSAEIGL